MVVIASTQLGDTNALAEPIAQVIRANMLEAKMVNGVY
jgi:hypothetical protein